MSSSCEWLLIFHIPRLIQPAKILKWQDPQTLPKRSHYEVWERERVIVLGGRSDRRAARYMERNSKKPESRTQACLLLYK